ncbi:Ig-like domain-containing protein [Roseburia faecis]|uniref:Ig-like domain-containing protein n=1 Tax=Roseburia faecis TaxID=301302 RepID=UPI003F9CB88F
MKQMKKLLCGLLMVCMMLTGIGIMPQTVQAKTASGNDGEIHWEIKGDTLTLSAVKGTNGRMKDYSWDKESPWSQKLTSKVKNIVIADSVSKVGTGTVINKNGFNPSTYRLDTLKIAGSVKTIPSEFIQNMSIKKIILCDGINKVEDYAFDNIPVKQLVVGNNIEITDKNFIWTADGACTNLQTVYTYSGSSAETMVKNFINYAKETEQTGGVTSTDSEWNGTNFGIYKKSGKDISINIVYLDNSTLLSSVKAPSSFSVNKGKSKALKITLPAGLTQVAKYTGSPADVKATFKSSNSKVATVSSSGKVTGKKKGTAKISISMQIKDGAKKTLTTKVTVK